MITEDFDTTKTLLKTVTNGNDHRIFYEKWLNIKKLLDVIISKLPPISHSETYTITLKPEEIVSVDQRFLANILIDLLKSDIVKLPSISSAVMSSESIRRLLRGESITIADKHRFENYWQEISKFCDFIEKDGKKRFSDAYSDALLMESLRKSVLNSIRNGQNISQRISPEIAYETIPETMDRLRAGKDISDNSSQQITQELSKLVITVKDREIWVNSWLLSKPHAIGTNFEMFEFISQKPKENITISILPESLKSVLGNKSLSKVLYELGFKGELLKAFFIKRGKIGVCYVGDEVTKNELVARGIRIPKLLKELEIANIKNRPV